MQAPIIWRRFCLDVLVSDGTEQEELELFGEWDMDCRRQLLVYWPLV